MLEFESRIADFIGAKESLEEGGEMQPVLVLLLGWEFFDAIENHLYVRVEDVSRYLRHLLGAEAGDVVMDGINDVDNALRLVLIPAAAHGGVWIAIVVIERGLHMGVAWDARHEMYSPDGIFKEDAWNESQMLNEAAVVDFCRDGGGDATLAHVGLQWGMGERRLNDAKIILGDRCIDLRCGANITAC